MKSFNLHAKIIVCAYEELPEEEKILIARAKEAVHKAYAPYSEFQVGAAIKLDNGEIICGNNQENGAFPSGLCAERTALFYANSQYPESKVISIAIAAFTRGDFTQNVITPCGGCRQVMLEAETRFKHPIRMLFYGKKEIYIVESVRDLLPLSFDGSELNSSL